ncbi:glycosyltransferase [Agromyces sp. Marseille-Q5079]|uniref:glycosyltransferase n=1 Tax=Agromyces sp. Marseille-Q5079 TaxID=3439059 RepID=UPI003D9C9D8D
MRALHKVLVFPAWRDNPYLNLLSLAPRAAGFEFSGVTVYESLVQSVGRLESGDVLHVHWTTPILQRRRTDADAWAGLAEFTSILDDLRGRGVRIIWTVHNRLPHELAHREPEIALHRLLAERSDVIHVMAPATPQVLAEVCELPADRVRTIAHPSYLGVYGAPPARGAARAGLGLGADERTVLFLGQMRPYKGLGTLLSAMRVLAERGDPVPTLLLAGSATAEAQAEITAALPTEVKAVTRFEFVPDAEVGTWFAAADLAVFPYTSILNSGSLHLSAAFDVPVLLPGEPHLVEQFGDEPWVGFFDLADPVESMATAITDALATSAEVDLTRRFDRFNAERSPWRISSDYADLLVELTTANRHESPQSVHRATAGAPGSPLHPV